MIPVTGMTAIIADQADAGERIDRVIADRVPALSRSRVKVLIESGRVAIDGATIANPSLRVKAGQSVAINIPKPVDDRPAAQSIALTILYEDEDLVVLDKPAGMVVHPAPGNPDLTLVNALLAHCGDTLQGIGGVRRPGIVHRLDKETSGVMVVAKTETAHTALSAAFADRTIERAYTAMVWGIPAPRDGTIDKPIGRSPINRKKMAVTSGGKPAVTLYHVVRPLGLFASLVECRLKTGRTHQIRVHMTELGHPLVGDPVYGRAPARLRKQPGAAPLIAFPRQALHAWLLGFTHPRTLQKMRFETALPADFTALIRALE